MANEAGRAFFVSERLCRNRFKHRDTELQSSLFYSYSINILSVFVSPYFTFCVLTHLRIEVIVVRQTPIARSRGPIVARQTPVARSRGPIVARQTPVARLREVIVACRTPVTRSRGGIVNRQRPVTKSQGVFADRQAAPASLQGVLESCKSREK